MREPKYSKNQVVNNRTVVEVGYCSTYRRWHYKLKCKKCTKVVIQQEARVHLRCQLCIRNSRRDDDHQRAHL